ncbi:MAG: mannose-1-phosphate guanylyltransferase [Ignavibacteriaceae bacterium]|jgi:mannose-1-phosphate guanylyltransferase
MNVFAVIMAGGVGSRFWPRSREKSPKQLLKIFDERTMIQSTVDRLEGFIPYHNIFIVTNKLQKEEISKQLPEIPSENILEEPFGRNTAAAIGLASVLIQKIDADAVITVLPADHIIREKNIFQESLMKAATYAYKEGGLLTIGIPPTRPETGYGYIQIDENESEENIFKVLTFAEKPNYDTALNFVQSGDFLWNSGMFIWRVDAIINEIALLMPELGEALTNIAAAFKTAEFEKILLEEYGQLRSISIDYGIMEKSHKVYLTKGKFTWSDVGSWEEVHQLSTKDKNDNALIGNVYADKTLDSYIYSPKKFTAVIGLDNVIVINTDDALLVCNRENAQEVKKVVDYIKLNKLNDYL